MNPLDIVGLTLVAVAFGFVGLVKLMDHYRPRHANSRQKTDLHIQ